MTSKEIRRIKKTLDTLEAGFVKRTQQLFDSIIPEMQPYVEDALRTGNVDSFELPGRKRYLVLFKRYLQELYAQGMTLADLELEAKRAKFDQHPSPAPIIPTGAMDWIDGWTSHFGDDYYGNATQDVVRVLKQGLGEGWSTEHTMDELSNYLKGPGYNKRRLEVIARTNATSAFNQGRLETFRQAGDFVKFVQFLAILDSRTTDICESRNGRLLRLNSPELAANTPPLHFQCRSMLSPVTAYDVKEMEKPGWKDAEGRTLEQLQDWSKVDAPAKGFGGAERNVLENKEISNKLERILAQPSEKKPKSMEIVKTYPEENSEKLYVKGEVKFPIKGFKVKELDLIESTLNLPPESHIKDIDFVAVTNNEILSRRGIANACYDEISKEIVINRRHTKLAPKKEALKIKPTITILHEIGHHVYNNFLQDDYGIGIKDKIKAVAEKYKNKILSKTEDDIKEYFANAYAFWYVEKRALAKGNPEMYNILRGIFEVAK